MLRRLSCLFTLYCFSRDLARFKSQTVLSGLPADFLLLRASRTPAEALGQTPEECLGRFLDQAGACLQTLAAFFALYPDIAGRGRADLLARATETTTDFADTADQDEQKRFVSILKVFYTLAGRDPFFKQLAETFEHILGEEADFRFEAAALERLNDHFYEDDCLKTLLPDWPRTGKDRLALLPGPTLRPLQATSDRKKTVSCLIKSVILMILRDGFVVTPSLTACRADDTGLLYFTRARLPVLLSPQERLFISSFLEALCVKNYPQAAKALMTSGFLPPLFPVPRLIRLIEETDRHATLLLNGQKADCFLKHFADNGIFFPYSIRRCVFALKKTEELCRTTLKTDGDIWQNGKTEFLDFLVKGKTATFKQESNTADIQTAFGPSPHHVERLAIQNKRMPSFQENPEKISELLYRHTLAARFRPAGRRGKLIVLLIAACLLAGLFFL